MADDPTLEDALARIAALEKEVCDLKSMARKMTAAIIDTAQASGYRLRHVKLARLALALEFLEYREFDQ